MIKLLNLTNGNKFIPNIVNIYNIKTNNDNIFAIAGKVYKND